MFGPTALYTPISMAGLVGSKNEQSSEMHSNTPYQLDLTQVCNSRRTHLQYLIVAHRATAY